VNIKHSALLSLAFCTSGLALVAPATAQDTPEEILVTAQRLNQTEVTGGGNVGVLGDKPAEDIPFNVRSYNEALILNQQPDTLGEVLENDPTIRTTLGFGISGEVFVIRGFPLSSDDVGFDGLYGIAPRQLVSPELLSSVQVINGASAFLNGAAPGGGGIGGSVNILPKRAERDLTRLTVGYTSDSHFSGAVDVARRFGANGEWGVRLNGAARGGDIAIEEEYHSAYVLGGTVDYRSGPFRASLNVNYQKLRQSHWRPKITVSTAIPVPPAAEVNYGQPWSSIETEDFFGTLNLEYDVAENALLYARFGARDGREDQYTSSFTLLDPVTGAGTGGGSYVPRTDNNESATAGLRVKLLGGGISHEINVGAAASWQVNRNAYDFFAGSFDNNLFDPVDVPRPASGFSGGNLADPYPITRTRVASAFASNTIGLWNDRVLVTGGLRLQEIAVKSYVYADGALTGEYRESAVTPVVGIVVKPVEGLSLYANRIEGLVQGAAAPLSVTDPDGGPDIIVSNGGDVLPPYKSVQYEFGGKLSFGRVNAALALFQIDRPNSDYRADSNNPGQLIYGPFGVQRNRGIEFTLDAEPVDGLRVIGGFAVNDPELRRTPGGVNQGNDAPGIPTWTANANVEWDLPFLPALTLTGRVVHTGGQAANQANTLRLDDWTRFDLGLRYVTLVAERPLTLRFNVDNVANARYWASAFSSFGTQLLQGTPRTFKLSASIDL
jgi:iron complex outermembrane recepter protein